MIRLRIAVPLALAIALGAAATHAPVVVALVAPLLIAIGAVLLVTGGAHNRAVRRWSLLSFFAHLGLGVAINFSAGMVNFVAPDAYTYHRGAIQLTEHWAGNAPAPAITGGKEGFFYGLATIYRVFGPHRIAGLVAVALCGALLVPVVADTCRRLFGDPTVRAVLPLVVLLPGLLLWTSHLLREAPIVLCIALAGNFAVRLVQGATFGAALGLAGATGLLFTLRANVAVLLAGGVIVAIALGRRRVTQGVFTAGAVGALMAVLVLAVGLGYQGYQLTTQASLGDVSDIRSALATGTGSSFAPGADVSTATGALTYLPVGATQLLVGPFPWQVRNFRQLLGLADAISIWLLVPSLVRGIREGWRRIGRGIFPLIIPALPVAAILALLIGNFGTIVRERPQILTLVLPLIALGRSLRAESAEVPRLAAVSSQR